MKLRAPAKLNLRLRVLGRAGDGFHDIETLFLRLALADELEIETGAAGIRLEVAGPAARDGTDGVPTDARNLCWRAAAAFCAAVGREPALSLRLTKRIPVAGGLGGGSSDAAAVLVALNREAGEPLDADGLLALAGTLGSDVPFFASGDAAALAWGRGERLLPLPPPPSRPVLVLAPTFGISAADAYRWWGEDAGPTARAGRAAPAGRLPAASELGDWEALARAAGNDLAGPVGRRHPVLEAAVTRLGADGASIALLCGSGSCVAGVFASDEARDAAAGTWAEPGPPFRGWRAIRTRTDPGGG